jgi:alpha,alpha-trehalase
MEIFELGQLFEEVQMSNILGDGKTFPDCVPNSALEQISKDYLLKKKSPDFSLQKFVADNFSLPTSYLTDYRSDPTKTAEQHLGSLWNVLTRKPDEGGGSLIALPHPYIVPGGRFREIYYWDSYFTMLGLQASGRIDLIENMVDNFSYLINKVGYIPNGNRTYFLGRSQPPFFSLMVQLLNEERQKCTLKGNETIPLVKYLPFLESEYQFWMNGAEQLTVSANAIHRVVQMQDGSVLNRYWDEFNTPRPEAYKEDIELSHRSSQQPAVLFRHLRAAAESGWDFSSRWFKDIDSFGSIHTTEIVPVDLNCLVYQLERTLAEAYRLSGNGLKSNDYLKLANQRKAAINRYCWSEDQKFFFDYDFVEQKQKTYETLAAAFPLCFEVATSDQAIAVAKTLTEKFLKPGGMTTTLSHSGQQWDAPNGWAPLQWITYKGLLKYGFEEWAGRLRSNWIDTNRKVYVNSGKMTEKYDVWKGDGEASGGEYPNQDGFGWTNGVFLAMNSIT